MKKGMSRYRVLKNQRLNKTTKIKLSHKSTVVSVGELLASNF